MSHFYDSWMRLYAQQYPDGDTGEYVRTDYNAMPTGLCSGTLSGGTVSCNSTKYAIGAAYDVAGRLTSVQYPAGGNLWLQRNYYPWMSATNGGLLSEIRVRTGTAPGSNNRFYRSYTYNPFGEVATLSDGSTTYNFAYDALGRLTSGYNNNQEVFSYWATGRFDRFKGIPYGYANTPFHAVNTINNVDRYDYDANGNMTVRAKNLSEHQILEWNAENQLTSVSSITQTLESYVYDVDGNRVQKSGTGGITYTFFPGVYEEEVAYTDTVWVEDGLPTGATPVAAGGDSWNWVPSPKYSGTSAHVSANVAGFHQHYFVGATQKLVVGANDVLYTWIYLDPANPPSEVMVQWNDGTWDHRAYWGQNLITCCGVDGTNSRRYMGPLPTAGKWVRLEVPASLVGLSGRTISGMAFTLFNGKATWDRAGKLSPTVHKISHYSFNGQIIATRRGSVLRYTHADHLGSASLQTDTSGNPVASTNVGHWSYGTVRTGSPTALNTDRTYTGQKQDGTGLLYYNARYYEPSLNQETTPPRTMSSAA